MNPLVVFANDLAKYFVLSHNKKEAATHIIYEINSRIGATSERLSEIDKKFILQLIEELICGKLQFNLKPGEMIARKQMDCDEFLSLKKYILNHVLNRPNK